MSNPHMTPWGRAGKSIVSNARKTGGVEIGYTYLESNTALIVHRVNAYDFAVCALKQIAKMLPCEGPYPDHVETAMEALAKIGAHP